MGKIYFIILVVLLIISGCSSYKKLLKEEVVLKSGNSITGSIIKSDSVSIELKKPDESLSIIPWSEVDTVKGKLLKTAWVGVNLGIYNTPYFSVFRNEPIMSKKAAMQFRIGMAKRGNRLYYLHLSRPGNTPLEVTKYGFGYQKYFKRSSYLKTNAFFGGLEFNLINVELNAGPQIALEPFTGYERKLNDHLRLNLRFGLHINLGNKNEKSGLNASIGLTGLRRNFTRHYKVLNKEHRIP